ncbi:MAG: tetratricopeptide repeat protein [Luteolibacter sp.]
MNRSFLKILSGFLAFFISATSVLAANSASIDQANKLFQSGDFAAAASIYQKSIDANGPSAALLYNLGNSRYRLGQHGPAILAYERAKLLTPRDPDLIANLNLARKAATVFDKGSFNPRLEAGLTWLSRNEWSWLVVGSGLWIGAISVFGGALRRILPGTRKVMIGSTVFAGLFIAAGSTALILRRDEDTRGIVLSKDAAVHLSPFEKAENIGTPGAGRIVQMGEKNGEYFYISVPGTELDGWMAEKDVEMIVKK